MLKDKRIHLLAIGMRLKHEVDANIKTLAGNTAFSPRDQALLKEFSPKVMRSDHFKKMRVD